MNTLRDKLNKVLELATKHADDDRTVVEGLEWLRLNLDEIISAAEIDKRD